MRGLVILVLLCLGTLLVVLFELGIFLPASWNITLMLVLTLGGIWKIRVSSLSLATRWFIVLYSVVFIATLGYLFDPNYSWWPGGELSLAYQTNPDIIALMTMIGLIGLVGLMVGMILAAQKTPKQIRYGMSPNQPRTLPLAIFVLILATALFFVWLITPTDSATYQLGTPGFTIATNILGFYSAGVVGISFIILAFLDAQRESKRRARRLKLRLLALGVVSVLFLQLSTGHRSDSFGMLLSLTALYLTDPHATSNVRVWFLKFRKTRLVALILIPVVVFYAAFGVLRASGERRLDPTVVLDGFRYGTWSAVLLTNLSLAGQYYEGSMVTDWGATYVDYFLSLPPGFLTKALGIERAIEPTHGPAWWFPGISAGGIDIALVPFKNFHTPGVLLVLLLVGYLIARIERAGAQPRVLNRIVYAFLFNVSIPWFWYGDMNFIRGMMIAAVLWVSYSMALSAFGRHASERNPIQLQRIGAPSLDL